MYIPCINFNMSRILGMYITVYYVDMYIYTSILTWCLHTSILCTRHAHLVQWVEAWGKFQSAVQGQLAEMSSEASAAELRQQKLMAQVRDKRKSCIYAMYKIHHPLATYVYLYMSLNIYHVIYRQYIYSISLNLSRSRWLLYISWYEYAYMQYSLIVTYSHSRE